MKFSKQKMIDRLKEEGRYNLITEDVRTTMDDLDGQVAKSNCWERIVNDEPVLWVIGKSGQGRYVNEVDCE